MRGRRPPRRCSPRAGGARLTVHMPPRARLAPATTPFPSSLFPPDSSDWYVELLSMLDASDTRDRAFDRIVLRDGGHYALASFRHLDVAAYEPIDTPEGLRCASLPMLSLSNLLRNPTIRPERMLAPGGFGPRRSNKDLGRVLTIARLAGRDAVAGWPAVWVMALRAIYPARWRELAARAGKGIRALLASEGDLREALDVSSVGLLAHVATTLDEFRVVAERLLVDAVEPLGEAARHPRRTAREAKGPRQRRRRAPRRPLRSE